MAVNIITKEYADKIAKNYLDNYEVKAVYVTRDGQVFLNTGYLKHHEKRHGLDSSWFYEKDKPEKAKEIKKSEPTLSFKELKAHFQELTNKEKIEKEDWENLKFAELRKKYNELNK